MYEHAQYYNDMAGNIMGIRVDINGSSWCVPLDPANTDYQNIMALVAEGKLVIQPAE